VNVDIDAAALRDILKARRMSQKELAEAVGMTNYNVSRWCSVNNTYKRARLENIKKIAQYLQVPYTDLVVGAKPGEAAYAHRLSDADADWLRIYRKLSPLARARARVAVEEIYQEDKDNVSQ